MASIPGISDRNGAAPLDQGEDFASDGGEQVSSRLLLSVDSSTASASLRKWP